MPATCRHCRFVTPCQCGLVAVKDCPDPKAELWVLVRDEHGVGVAGAPFEIGEASTVLPSTIAGVTDRNGIFMTEMAPGQHTVTVAGVPDALLASHDPPEDGRRSVDLLAGTIGQVVFDLRLKRVLEVELVGTNITGDLAAVTAGAKVFLEMIVGTRVQDGRKTYATTPTAERTAADRMARFDRLNPLKYQVRVELAPSQRSRYYAETVQCELLPSERYKKVVVPVGEMFTRVRFIGLCVAAVARQIWLKDPAEGDPDEKLLAYLATRHKVPAAVPDFTARYATYDEDLQSFWSTYEAEQEGRWGARYNGHAHDPKDIAARVDLLRSAIHQARAGLTSDSDQVLKVFLAPECFFLGRYGAYPHEMFGSLLRQLQELVSGDEWKCWVFAFGTVNGYYELDGRTEMFNMTPVLRGGSAGRPEPASRFVRLLQKSMFSQEIPTEGELELHGDELRPPLTEETVSAGFQATEYEEIIGSRVMTIIRDCHNDRRVDLAADLKVNLDELATMCAGAEKAIQEKGLYAFVRLIRGGEAEVLRKNAVAKTKLEWKAWHGHFKSLVAAAMADRPDIATNVAEGARVMNPRDFSFSCLRMPGPWLDHVVESGEDEAERKLTFSLEICADHLQGRFMTAAKDTKIKTDIHLVPSAGAYLKSDSLGRLNDDGFAFNCDGWNCPSGSRVFERNGRVVLVEDELIPRQVSRNPLLPHTELWVAKTGAVRKAEMDDWARRTEETKREIARLEQKFKDDTLQNEKNFADWEKKGRIEADKPVPPQAPHKPPLPNLPASCSYLMVEKVIRMPDKVDEIFPYDSSDRSARWAEIETKLRDRLAAEQLLVQQDTRARIDEENAQKAKEEAKLLKYREGGKIGPTTLRPLADLEADALRLKDDPTEASRTKRLVETRRSQIANVEKIIAGLNDKLAELAAAAKPFDPASVVLPPLRPPAAPELHIYPEQPLPVPK